MQSRSIYAAGCALLLCLPIRLLAEDAPEHAPENTPENTIPLITMPLVAQADANSSALEYHSAFRAYVPFQSGELVPWAEANARVAVPAPAMPGHAAHTTGGAP